MSDNGRMLTHQSFSNSLDSISTKLQLNKGSYNTQSFRIGAATSAMEAEIFETQVKMLGR